MKSYLRFLSRNKLYTAIEIVGLSLALAFVIVLSAYIVEDMSVNDVLKNTKDIYLCHDSKSTACYEELHGDFEKLPAIEETCTILPPRDYKVLISEGTHVRHADKEINVAVLSAPSNFFEFFTFPLAEGTVQEALATKNSIVISEEIANTFFPDGTALGKEVNLYELNHLKSQYPGFKDIDVNLTVTGIFKPFSKTVFHTPDIIIHIDLFDQILKENYLGIMRMPIMTFMRVNDASEVKNIEAELSEACKRFLSNYSNDIFGEQMVLTRFDHIKKEVNSELDYYYYFTNLRNVKLFGIYLTMCIFLTIVALLDYVVLTIAFSRFRIKEIATRQLLGTDRSGIIGRCFIEAFLLLVVSCFFAVLIAITFKEPVSEILGMEINPFSHLNEYLALAAIILIMVALASSVPSILLSSYSSINVIKGEARYKDKIIYGKIFIGLAGLLSICALSICFGITRQTRHLINQPLGYETEGLVAVSFIGKEINRFRDELLAEPCVEKIGTYVNHPVNAGRADIKDNAGRYMEVRMIYGDKTFFEILGIEVVRDFNVMGESTNIYYCESTYNSLGGYIENNMIRNHQGLIPLSGTVSDIKIGRLKEDTSGIHSGITIIDDFSGWTETLCIKVTGKVDEAYRKIKEFYYSKGYNDDIVAVTYFKKFVELEIQEEQNILKLLSGFSILCILMTVMTIVGLSSYHAKSNEKDNAVRNVFGCSRKELVMKLVFDFVLPVVISAVVAIPVAWSVIDRWLEGYAIRTDNSPAIYISALAVILAIVIAAISAQAFRLMRTNPAEALKKE